MEDGYGIKNALTKSLKVVGVQLLRMPHLGYLLDSIQLMERTMEEEELKSSSETYDL